MAVTKLFAKGTTPIMPYADYLREQSSDCIQLAVEQPWGNHAGDLIDLALNYSAMASSLDDHIAPAKPAAEPRLWQLFRGSRQSSYS